MTDIDAIDGRQESRIRRMPFRPAGQDLEQAPSALPGRASAGYGPPIEHDVEGSRLSLALRPRSRIDTLSWCGCAAST